MWIQAPIPQIPTLRRPHGTAPHLHCTYYLAPTTSHPLRSIYVETFIPLACRLRSLLMDSLFLL